MASILGLDFGTRRIGAAICDSRGTIASPLEVYERRDPAQDLRHYQKLVREHGVERIVVGLPVHLSGREGTSASLARDFGAWLARGTGVPVVYHDERFTTAEAEASLIDAGLQRSKRKGLRDMLAARLLLQGYLDDGCPEESKPILPLQDRTEHA